MEFRKKEKKIKDLVSSDVFNWQKVKFYKIKHFIFDFGGVLLIEKTHVMKILFQIIADDLKFNIYSIDKKGLNFRQVNISKEERESVSRVKSHFLKIMESGKNN